jgi:hypothetical protein
MKNALVTLIIVIVVWQGYAMYRQSRASPAEVVPQVDAKTPITRKSETPSSTFQCDGRTYCSQMTSCAEATYFLKNCPEVKMDGDNDGIPCEKQWCR